MTHKLKTDEQSKWRVLCEEVLAAVSQVILKLTLGSPSN